MSAEVGAMPTIDCFSAFAEDGSYRTNKDDAAIHDVWLENVSRKDIEKARIAQQKQENRQQKIEKANEAQHLPSKPLGLWTALIGILQNDESATKAMRRLAPSSSLEKSHSAPKRIGSQQARKKMNATTTSTTSKQISDEATLKVHLIVCFYYLSCCQKY